jgi:hypothetical protein
VSRPCSSTFHCDAEGHRHRRRVSRSDDAIAVAPSPRSSSVTPLDDDRPVTTRRRRCVSLREPCASGGIGTGVAETSRVRRTTSSARGALTNKGGM